MREATTAEGSENVAPDDSVAMWFDLHVDDLFRYTSRRVGGDAARDVVSETFASLRPAGAARARR